MKTGSILNDVLGPIMAGPSSSHTAAPGKIGLAVYQLWGQPIQAANIVYEARGSYPSTHIGQGSDFGFAGGLLGMTTDMEDFRHSLEIAASRGVKLRFDIRPLDNRHPNEARIDVLDEAGRPAMSCLSFSTGGGTFLICELDGFPVSFDGQRRKAYACCASDRADGIARMLSARNAVFERRAIDPRAITFTGALPEDAVLFEIECASLEDDDLTALPELIYLRTARPSSMAMRLDAAAPFATAAEALALAGSEADLTMADLAMRYELGLLNATESEAREQMRLVLSVMRRSMVPPDEDDPIRNRIAPMMARKLEAVKRFPIPMGMLDACVASAVAVMENSCAHRTVVAAPTAGSSGLIPAVLVSMGDALGCDDDGILDALWASGLVGAFIANQATFGAEIAGCQAEIGAAACMAAAGAVQLAGGSVKQGFDAACIAMQSLLGLICDPVGGLTEFPCIERNVTAAAVSVMAANMAMCGMTSLVTLDETIRTMLDVGQKLPEEMRCTCRGGLCATESGRMLARSLERGD